MKLEVQEDKRAIRVRIELEPSDVMLTETPLGTIVEIAGFSTAGEPGGPALPARAIEVALPALARVADVRVRGEERLLTEKPTFVAPRQLARPGTPKPFAASRKRHNKRPRPYRKDDDGLALPVAPQPYPRFVEPDQRQYDAAVKSPPPVARLVAAEDVGATSIATILLRPVRYDAQGRLVITPQIDVELEHTGGTALRDLGVEEVRRRLAERHVVSAAQAARVTELAQQRVLNPSLVELITDLLPPAEAEYVIITDNQRWDAARIAPIGPTDGDLVAKFRALVTWKRSRGLTARVFTIANIVAGRYGDFRTGARDLQEVLRRFLQHAHARWGTAWVLLGGDVDIVPPRQVPGCAWGGLGRVTADKPAAGEVSWQGTYLRVHQAGLTAAETLVHGDTGTVIPFDGAGTSSTTVRGWYHTTDDTYATRSAAATQFVRVNGPAAEVNGWLLRVRYENTIPTDFYYASLAGPSYGKPGVHDWDSSGNGLYGQHKEGAMIDEVELRTDVSVGRAPAATAAQAEAFVKKVIAYERRTSLDGTRPLDRAWPTRLVITAANWGGRIGIGATTSSPPGNHQYHHATGADHTRLQLESAPTDLRWQLLAEIGGDPRLLPYATTGRGWHFARSATDATPSQRLYAVSGMSFQIPVPTRWIVVRSPVAAELTPAQYILDHEDADGSMVDQEALRTQIAADLGTYDVVRLYEDEIDLTPGEAAAAPIAHLTADRLREALDAGPHYVSMSGHGWSGGCCGMSPALADGLRNDGHTFIAYADSCLTNEFNVDDAVSEHLVLNPHGGAVAYVGSSRFSWIGVGDEFQRAFFRRLSETRRLGTAFDVRASMWGAWTGFYQQYNTWTIFALNLMGDPEMPVWGPPPIQIRVDVPHEIPRKRPWELPITFDRAVREYEVKVTLRQGDLVETAVVEKGRARVAPGKLAAGPVEIVAAVPGAVPIVETAVLVDE